MEFKLEIRESTQGRSQKPVYEIMLGTQKIDQLSLVKNVRRGKNVQSLYDGVLIDERGNYTAIGCRALSGCRKLASEINRKAHEVMENNDSSPIRVIKALRTTYGPVRKLVFDDDSSLCVWDREYRAACELFGQDGISPEYFRREQGMPMAPEDTGDLVPGELYRPDDLPITYFVMNILKTSDPNQVAVVFGQLPCGIDNILQNNPNIGIDKLAELTGPDWGACGKKIFFESREDLDEIIALNGRDLMPAILTPCTGFSSVRMRIFDKWYDSGSGPRPIILPTPEQAEFYSGLLEEHNLEFNKSVEYEPEI